MRKLKLLAGIAMLCSTFSYAQNVDHSVISTAGDISRAAGIELEWTVGEAVTEQGRDNSLLLTQGFHQTFIRRMIVIAPPNSELLSSIVVAPNPVRNNFSVLVNSPKSTRLQLTLTDASGQVLQNFSALNKSQLQVQMSGYTPGFYLLRVTTDENVSRTFKIIKIN